MIRRDDATERQVQAADPAGSVWLSANAGSGKTRVLTDRVARLLLDQVSPLHILCLTYTKAAASEMQNRLFHRLGAWAMQEDDALRAALLKLGVEGSVDAEMLARARRLFAGAIETPGGLKIQTIHSFCAALLRRFPLEAGVSPQFVEMDERAAKLLREDIVEELADGAHVDAVDGVARFYSAEDFARLTQEVVRYKSSLSPPPDATAVWQRFGLQPGLADADVLSGALTGAEGDLLRALIPALQAGSANDVKAAGKLSAVSLDSISVADLPILEGVFLFGPKTRQPNTAKIGSFPTAKTRTSLGALEQPLNEFMARIEATRETRLGLYSAQKTLALHEFAHAFLPEYEARKQAHGWLDFDDLILKARALLSDPMVAQWVLYRLDGGIDHILVDEAQDTSPAQWDVIERLAQEFTTGEGARSNVARSIFVVGDKKQSIYSFQGADLEGFDRMRAHFGEKFRDAQSPFAEMQLAHSFRSAGPVLRFVDTCFQERAGNGLGGETLHIAFKDQMPGRVDLWPVVAAADAPEKKNWYDPVDIVSQNHHSVVLANRIAEQIASMVASATVPQEIGNSGRFSARKVRPGDVLILVQRRSDLFHEIIRACKARGLPIAGADRLKVGAELAVRDLVALLSFLATPEDDLSLASALRSPLFGWSQQALHGLAQPRAKGEYLWAALRSKAGEHAGTHETLQALRDEADFLRPYDLIERILTRHDGRRALLARLGAEAEDGIDALLQQALAYERMDVPSLTGFLTWLSTGDVEIKRQMDSAGDQIRVMTVHGAKGLEAPIVILPDSAARKIDIKDEVYPTPAGPVWKTRSDERPAAVRQAHEKLIAQQEAERDRLLYVAMTRAEKWLIVAAAGDLGKDGKSWHDIARSGMEASGALPFEFDFGAGLRLEAGDWVATPNAASPDSPPSAPEVPEWAQTRATPPGDAEKTLAPSDLGGAKALPGDDGLDEEAALLRGTRLHLLLEHLPGANPPQREALALALLSASDTPASEDEARALLAETQTVLNAPDLAHLFTKDALAEVDISASLTELGGRRIHGAIDRLLVSPDTVLAVDFKSNATVPGRIEDVPEGLLRQMGAYQAALMQIYPGRVVQTAIVWTRTAALMPLPQEIVIKALARATTP